MKSRLSLLSSPLFSGPIAAVILASCASGPPPADVSDEATAKPSPAVEPVEALQSAEEWAQDVTKSCGFTMPSICDGEVCSALGTFPQNDANGRQFASALAYRSPLIFTGVAVTRAMGFSDTPCSKTLAKAPQGKNFLWGNQWTSLSGWNHICFATRAGDLSDVQAEDHVRDMGRAAGLCDTLLVQKGEERQPFTALFQAAMPE